MLSGQHNAESSTLPLLTKRQGLPWGFDRRDLVRYEAKIQRGPACWLWTSNKTRDGYGQMWVGMRGRGGPVYAHRLAWILAHGPIPGKAFVLHRCDTPACVNPAHLFLGTHTDNMRDASAKGRLSVPRPSGQKVTSAQLREIDDLLRGGLRHVDIARRYGVSRAWISLYAKGERRQCDRAQAAKGAVA